MAKCFFVFPLLISVAFIAKPTMADDFSDTIAYAYAHHPDIRAAQENLEAVRDTIWEAHGGYQPTVIANYERGRKRFQFDGSDQKYVNTTTKQLTVSQPIFRGGGTLAQIKTARALTRAEEARFFNVGQEVLLGAISAYARVIEAAKVLEINRDNVDRLEQHMEATRTRRKAKDLTVTDVALSESRLSRAESSLHDAEGNYDSARATFFREVGKQPEVAYLPPLPTNLPDTQDEVLAQSKKHPSLTIAEEQEKAADSTIDSRISTILPNVSLQGKLEEQEGISTLSSSLNNLREDSITLRVSIPLYQSGAEYARISQARHRYQKARSDAADTVRDTKENALNTWHGYVAAKGAVESNKRAYEAASRALSGIQEEYKYGARTVLDVLDTQQELFAAEQALIRAQTRQVITAYSLKAALGQLDPQSLRLNIKDQEEESQRSAKKAPSFRATPVASAIKLPPSDDGNLIMPPDELQTELASQTPSEPYRIDLTVPPEKVEKSNRIADYEPAAGAAKAKTSAKKDKKSNSLKAVSDNPKLPVPTNAENMVSAKTLVQPEESTSEPSEMDSLSLPSIARRGRY